MYNSKTNNYIIFIIIVVLNIFSVFITKDILTSDELIYNYYSDLLTHENIQNFMEFNKKWWWVSYVVIPLVVFIRSGLVALCLSVGLFFYDTEKDFKFKNFIRIALQAEFVLVLVGFSKLFYFSFLKKEYTLKELQQFFPLSYTNFLNLEVIEPWLIYPLQTINLFEITYFFVLVYGLHKLLQNKYWKSFEIVAMSYGTGLIIWLGLVMFLTLNVS